MSIYTEPTKTVESVLSAMKASEVRKGDRVSKTDRKGNYSVHVVADVKTGPKWTYLRDADGRLIMEVESGVEIDVTRDVETQESITARSRFTFNEAIERAIEGQEVYSETKKAMAKIEEAIAKGHLVSSFEMSNLVAAQAADKVQAQFAAFVKDAVTHGLDHVDALDRFREVLKERLIGSFDLTRGLSRSTSVMSNVMDDAEREAIAEFVRRDRWYHF